MWCDIYGQCTCNVTGWLSILVHMHRISTCIEKHDVLVSIANYFLIGYTMKFILYQVPINCLEHSKQKGKHGCFKYVVRTSSSRTNHTKISRFPPFSRAVNGYWLVSWVYCVSRTLLNVYMIPGCVRNTQCKKSTNTSEIKVRLCCFILCMYLEFYPLINTWMYWIWMTNSIK